MGKFQLVSSFAISLITAMITTLVLTAGIGLAVWLNPKPINNWLNDYVESRETETATTNPTVHIPPTGTQQDLVVSVVHQVQPAVVNISISKEVPVYEEYVEEYDSFFGPGFQVPQYRQNGTELQEIGGGSGFIVTEDGLVVTNRHVVSDTDASYTVFMHDGSQYEAEVIARDPINDIAVLRITREEPFPFVEFGDSTAINVGQTVIAIGNALSELENSVSVGVVSGVGRSIEAGDAFGQSEQIKDVIQTDAAINPGNSGGPLLDLTGNVIGVNVAVAFGSENIGFALPANTVAEVVDSVKAHGAIVRPYLGVRYVDITPQIAETNGLPVEYGALIIRGETVDLLAVIPGSPADKAGLVENDIILEMNGQPISEENSLADIIAQQGVGDTVSLKILHDGEEQILEATLEAFEQ